MKKTEPINTLDLNCFLMHVILNETEWNEESLSSSETGNSAWAMTIQKISTLLPQRNH